MKILLSLSLSLILLFAQAANVKQTYAQRSLHHWKRDLEHRLNIYQNQRDVINNIIASSIYPGRQAPIQGPARVTSGGNVRFSDLIIPTGSLVLESHIARPTVRILVDKTQDYVKSKMSELYHIRSQLETINRQINDPNQNFIYKGLRGHPQPQYNLTGKIQGTRIFKQVHYAYIVDSRKVVVDRINYTNVDQVLKETYMEHTNFGLLDSEQRLFFEGRKTFWNTFFAGPLKSGCCDRLKPLHTNRMMLRSVPQDIQAPIMIYSNVPFNSPTAIIRNLTTNQMYNRALTFSPWQPNLPPIDNGLVPTPMDNYIQLHNLISNYQFDQPEIQKTIVFKDIISVDEGFLSNSYPDNRLLIGILGSSNPGLSFDLSHDNYLLRFAASRNDSSVVQKVFGTTIMESSSHFSNLLDVNSVNGVTNFNQFVREAVVRIDRPAIISGPVQFNALPTVLNEPNQPPQRVSIMQIEQSLEVGLVNGMRLPHDIVVLPNGMNNQNQVGIKPTDVIRIRGPRDFSGRVVFKDLVQVSGLVNGISMPDGVIPLHLNDFMSSVGRSNLWFVDGIRVHHMIVQGGQFDEIVLRDVYGDAQSLIMRSMLSTQPDGTQIIRAPLHITNLRLLNQGLLNGFRPQEVMELSKHPFDTLYGRKTFSALVEADDCVFNDINYVANWTNHVIRTDRPNTVQTIHTKLSFARPYMPLDSNATSSSIITSPTSSVNVDRFRVEFYPDNNPVNYALNWNFSPEFYILHQALLRNVSNHTSGRYRVLNQLRLVRPGAKINNIDLNDIVTLDTPFRFQDRYVMVGKVEVHSNLEANRITSNYPIDVMDLVQFNKYRIPITGLGGPIRLNNLVMGVNNRASYVQCQMLNGIPFNEFANSIMSLTRPQIVHSNLQFGHSVEVEGLSRTQSSFNGIKNFRQFAANLKDAKYSFEDGLQCNSVNIQSY